MYLGMLSLKTAPLLKLQWNDLLKKLEIKNEISSK
jgi:hypothetical protein